MYSSEEERRAVRRAARMGLVYALFGALWITFSDQITAWLFSGPAVRTAVQTGKGWIFVGITALAFFLILRRRFLHDARVLAEREAERRELEELNQFREAVIDNASIWINVLDRSGSVTLWNKAAEQISGYSRDEALLGSTVWEWLYPDPEYRDRIAGAMRHLMRGGGDLDEFETRIRTRGGEERTMLWSSRRLFGVGGTPMGIVAIGRDVTESRRTEEALRERERELATLLGNLPGMAYRCRNDAHWTMLYVSQGAREVTGYEPEQLLDNPEVAFADLILPEDRQNADEAVQRALAAGRSFALEYRIRRRSGDVVWVWEQGCSVDGEDGARLEGIIMEIDERKQMERKLASLAIHDPLTGLYNRRELDQQFADEVERARRYGRPLALLWLDVDEFKAINDRHGHLVGDDVLRALARLLQENIRNVDYAARYGGEELAVVMPEMGVDEAREAAARLRSLTSDRPLVVDGAGAVRVTVSVGVAVFPDHGGSADELLQAADEAMYAAKRLGRNRICVAGER